MQQRARPKPRAELTNAALPPREAEEIDLLTADITDPVERDTVRAGLIREAQQQANQEALKRRRYRSALEQARLAGDPDPEGTAAQTVHDQGIIDLHNEGLRAIHNRVDHRTVKARDKHERRREAVSKTAKPSLRRLPQQDRIYVEIIGEAEKGGWLADIPSVLSKINSKIPGYRLPHWEKTTISLKVLALSLESVKDGAQTINLRINRDICEKALASPRGPAGFMQDRIRKEFEKTFGKANAPEFWFVIETDSSLRFHLHGAVETPSILGGVKLVDDALRAAGGAWDHPGGHQHQQVAKSLDDPAYWASYCLKHMNIDKGRIARKLFAHTSGIRSRAEATWDDVRATLPQAPRRKAP